MLRIGTWAEIPTPYTIDIMLKAGFDFTIIDMEHGIIDFETAQNMVFAAHGNQKEIYIRVPTIDESWILRAIDTGCDGIIFPQVTRREDIEKVVEYSRFAPIGKRGFNPYVTVGGYTGVSSDFFEKENKRLKIGIILEGKQAFDNIVEILRCPEIDIVYIGQYDLSVAMGVPGDVNHRTVLEIMENAVQKINKYGKMAGCMVHNKEDARKFIKQGFSFVVYKVDSGILYQSVYQFVRGIKNETF